MRAETELIQKIKELKKIEPRKEWVFCAKKQLFSQRQNLEQTFSFSRIFGNLFTYKYGLASLVVFLLIGGIFVSAQGTLPGDLLYPVKKATEKARLVLTPREQQPNIQLEYANERLENLVRVAQEKKIEKLAPLIEEYQANISEAAKSLKKVKEPDVKEIVEKTKELEANKEKAESLGIVIEETKEFDNALAQLVKKQIEDLEKSSLSSQQEKIFVQARKDYQEGKYSQALEKILILSYPQEK